MADYGVVIGVSYPAGGPFTQLQGTKNDADAFFNWLQDAGGGDVPVANIEVVGLSPPRANTTKSDIENAFEDLVIRARRGDERQGRLFIYASGHGFSSGQFTFETGLVTSDCTDAHWRNVALSKYADFFVMSGMFDSVILLLDCCRGRTTTYPIAELAAGTLKGQTRAKPPAKVQGHACHWGVLAKEHKFGDEYRGYFSKALEEAFNHMPGDLNGNITPQRLNDFVAELIESWQDPARQVPVPVIEGTFGTPVVLGKARALPKQVTLEFAPRFIGQRATIQFDGQGLADEQFAIPATPVVVELKCGNYKVEVEGLGVSVSFMVPINQHIHVE